MLIDKFGRKITYLRFSVTSRCNFNCFYCSSRLPSDALSKEFNLDDISFIFNVVSDLGISKVRITGGEPLLRQDIVDVVKESRKANFREIVLTTNGFRLFELADDLKQAGLSRVNVSLDTLRGDIFEEITGSNSFEKVVMGILKAIDVGLAPVKINTILLKGINEEDIVPIAELTIKYPVIVRFIELMPVKGNSLWKIHYLSFKDAYGILSKHFDLIPLPRNGSEVADYFKIQGSEGSIGFITPVSQHFCSFCNRLRLTASGKIFPCLFSPNYIDIFEEVKGRDTIGLSEKFKLSVNVKPKEHGEIKLDAKEFIENMRELGG